MVKKPKKSKKSRRSARDIFNNIIRRLAKFPRPSRRTVILAANIIFVILASILIMRFLQLAYSQGGGNGDAVFRNPRIVSYTILILATMITFLIGVTGSTIFATAILVVVSIGLGFANNQKLRFRDAPLLPEDLLLAPEADTLIHFVSPVSLTLVILAILATIALAIIAHIFIRRHFSLNLSKKTRRNGRIAAAAISALILVAGTDFIRNSNYNYDWNDFLGTYLVAWSQTENYERNGFVIGFIYNIQARRIPTPDGFSAAAVTEIIARYQTIATERNIYRTSLSEDTPHIIFIMNESFFDPTIVRYWFPFSPNTSAQVPTPNLHALRNHPRAAVGWHFSPEYGGGTANIEFEALTGLTNYFANIIPFTHFASRRSIPSIASHLRQYYNFTTTGIHNFGGTMYKRNLVYPNLGFHRFYDQSSFPEDTPRIGNFMSDASIYDRAMNIIDNSSSPQFLTLITMQNHMPFHNLFPTHRFTSLADISSHDQNLIMNFMELLYYSDRALGELIARIDASDERIALVFWGDHAPGIFGQFRDENHLFIHKTPLLFYANFPIPDNNFQIGTISPNFITTTFFDFLGVQKPFLHHLLDDVRLDTPVLARPYFRTMPRTSTQALRDYEFINYHFSRSR